MKNSETEKEITGLIKGVLDNYQEDYIPGAWEHFVNVRKRKKRIILYRIASGIAACLIFTLLGINYFNPAPEKIPAGTVVKNKSNQTLLKNEPIIKNETLPALKKIPGNDLITNKFFVQKKGIRDSKTITENNHNPVTTDAKGTEISQSDQKIIENTLSSDSLNNIQYLAGADSSILKNETKRTGSSDLRSLSKQDLYPTIAANQVQTASEKKRIRIGINFSPGFNSTEFGSGFSYSGGLNTDISLFTDFYLSTGLQVEHQSVINGSNVSASLPASRTKADLVNLDLPVNLTWKFISGKSRSFYVSGGVSSLAYLSEKYDRTTFSRQVAEVKTLDAGVDRISYQIKNIETTTQKSESSFNTVDLAGRVNILFGIEQKISPKLYLHIEPYIKIPVSELATENLRFSTGGISCKVSF